MCSVVICGITYDNFFLSSDLSLLIFCNINGTQLQSLPTQLAKLLENDPCIA
jgi:hypothetical protein